MSNPNELTEAENNLVRMILAFVQLPGSRLKLSKSEQEALQQAQAKLNQNW